MSEMTTGYEAIHVHVENLEDLSSPGHKEKRILCKTYTRVLSSSTPTDQILDRNPKRLYALVRASTNATNTNNSNVIIATSLAEAQAAINSTTTQSAPVGFTIGFGDTFPTKIPGRQAWWATAAVYPSLVSVLTVEEE